MSKTWLQAVLVLSYITLAAYCGLVIMPERAKLVYVNEKYFSNFSTNVKRYSRDSAYCFNIEMTLKKPWTNNVTIHVIFNEYLHNEYRRTFFELHSKYCDLVNFDKFVGPMILHLGFGCPLPAVTLKLNNFNFPMDKFPNVFPFERTRVDTEIALTSTNESMAVMYHYVTFKNTKRT